MKQNRWILNKKGDISYYQLMFAMYRAMILVIVIVSILLITKIFAKITLDTQEAEMELFAQQLLYSQNGISYYDDNLHKVYPGIIDYRMLKNKAVFENKLMQAFHYKEFPLSAAQFEIVVYEQSDEYEIFEKIHYQKEYFEQLHVLAQTGIGGAGGAKEIYKEIPVIIRKETAQGTQFYPAMLKMVIVSSNS